MSPLRKPSVSPCLCVYSYSAPSALLCVLFVTEPSKQIFKLLHKTRAIILKTVKYRETSLVVTAYTEVFGVQSYIVNGVRTHSKKGSGRANLFQPASILDMVVYHNEHKTLQRISEFKWGLVYRHLLFDVEKNTVALFMVELLQKCLRQPEPNPDLFYFIEDSFLHLDACGQQVMANFPLFFALQLSAILGFRISEEFSPETSLLDLKEGRFVGDMPMHPHFLNPRLSATMAELLKVMQPAELAEIQLNRETRQQLLHAFELYYALHVEEFGALKTLSVLREVWG